MGIAGTARMRKSQLIAAIQEKQGGTAEEPRPAPVPTPLPTEVSAPPRPRLREPTRLARAKQDAMEPQTSPDDRQPAADRPRRPSNGGRRPARGDAGEPAAQLRPGPPASADARRRPPQGAASPQAAAAGRRRSRGRPRRRPAAAPTGRAATAAAAAATPATAQQARGRGEQRPRRPAAVTTGVTATAVTAAGVIATAVTAAPWRPRGTVASRRPRRAAARRPAATSTTTTTTTAAAAAAAGSASRNRRGRERARQQPEPAIGDDDVLIPIAGILDILDNYAFVRTTGYLPGPNDVYVSLAQVRKQRPAQGRRHHRRRPPAARRRAPREVQRAGPPRHGQRHGPRAGHGRGPSSPSWPRCTRRTGCAWRPSPSILTTRIIDLVAPIGKGQRGLIVSPPKAGKTMILQAIANAITKNNPECHLMVVLVDERPEEVTDMQRSVKGEVIHSTFDRPAEDHTTVAELAIERAKRLVELGHDVVVLLDSITRLGRAYNLAAPASGRILSGGVDSTALYPPKRFFGAARNIENGGSLTILATALVETGSRMDEVIFEEFKGTGNMELRLRRELADKRMFPAVDVDASSTRKEEILMAPDELQIVWQLRRVLHALDPQQALELLMEKMKETKSNAEFLLQVQKTTLNS